MSNLVVLADLGAGALVILYVWLASGIICTELSRRKGYGDRPGLGSGLLLSVIGVVIWLIIPARKDSLWANRRARKKAAAA
jgi:hypothetical protein